EAFLDRVQVRPGHRRNTIRAGPPLRLACWQAEPNLWKPISTEEPLGRIGDTELTLLRAQMRELPSPPVADGMDYSPVGPCGGRAGHQRVDPAAPRAGGPLTDDGHSQVPLRLGVG